MSAHGWRVTGTLVLAGCLLLLLGIFLSARCLADTNSLRLMQIPDGVRLALKVEIEGKNRTLILDTGARFTVINATPKARCEKSQSVASAMGASQEFCSALVDWRIATHKQSSNLLFGHLAAFDATGIDGVLGMDMLKNFSSVRIDLRSNSLALEEK